MKNTKKLSRKAAVFVTLFIIILIFSTGLAIYLISRANESSGANSTNSINLEPPTVEQLNEGERIKEESLNEDSSTPPDSTVDMYFTASFVNGNTYRLRVFINKLSSDGSCTVSLTSPGSDPLTLSPVGIQPLPDGSTCKGFDIPLSDLSASTTWLATVEFTGPDSYGRVSEEISL